jgi:putative ATP-dependent endonuclease of the OLD family
MKLESIRIRNLRACRDVTVPLNPYTSLVGPNGSGKSTVLTALNIFFREMQQGGPDITHLVEEDFYQKNTIEPITITLTFAKLSPEAQADFAAYYRDGKLIISAEAVFDPSTRRAEVKQHGERMVMAEFAGFFEAASDGAKVADLRTKYAEAKSAVPGLPAATTKDAMTQALRDYETAHPERCKPIRSPDEFYGFSKGANRLGKYIQWVYVPAVKDATTEQVEARNTALGRILARTVRAKTQFGQQVDGIRRRAQKEYESILEASQGALDGLTASLQNRLSDWAHPEATVRLEWWQDPDRAISVQEPAAQIIAGEDKFEGQLCRLGHGLQRSYLLALLQELANSDDPSSPRLILGCEEPELYQHPPQAWHLFDVFQKLTTANTQVVVATHSPIFVTGTSFEDVRLVRKDAGTKETIVRSVTYDQISSAIARVTGENVIKREGIRAKLQQTLLVSLNEMFFTRRLILVEGLEDIAYIASYLQLANRSDDYRRLGCHMIAVGGKDHLIQPLAIAKELNIPTLVVFDSDADQYGPAGLANDPNGYRAARYPMHRRDNTAILKLCGIATPDPFPAQTLFTRTVVMWHSEIGSVVEEDIGADDWNKFKNAAEQELGQPGGLQKNSLQIALTLANAWEAGKRSRHLGLLCDYLLDTVAATPAATAMAESGGQHPVEPQLQPAEALVS